MLVALALSAVMCADAPSAPAPTDETSYRAAEAKAGRDADAHVKLALWAEAHGMTAERAKHLAMAVAADPAHAVARGLMGFVQDGGRWRRPEDVADRAKEDAAAVQTLVDYEARREEALATADGQWKLSQWCDAHGLKPQAEAHARAAVRLDPKRKAAWERLGYKNRNGRWMTDEQVADERREAELQERADRTWRPRLAKLRDDLRVAAKAGVARRGLADVSDPRAVPSILRVFATADPRDQAVLVQLLGQVDGGPASRSLAVASIIADSPEARRAAAETLVRRDPRDFVSDLIGWIREVRKYEVRPVDGPGSTGILFVEGKQFDIRRRYEAPDLRPRDRQLLEQMDALANGETAWGADAGTISRIANGLRPTNASEAASNSDLERRRRQAVNNLGEMVRAADSAQRQLERDVAALDAENATARVVNDRVVGVLSATTGGDLGPDRESWAKWWTDRQGYAFVSPPAAPFKPVFDQNVPAEYQPRIAHSCFAQGTPVRTRDGAKPIEVLHVGDLVLSQDVVTGRLAYEPIVAVFHNPPAATVEVRSDSDAIVATGIHRFWSAGKGWTMARDLKPGDRIRTAGGVEQVRSISPHPVQPVFNLEVSRGRSFFVGKVGALVHDNSLVETTPEPFDAPSTDHAVQ